MNDTNGDSSARIPDANEYARMTMEFCLQENGLTIALNYGITMERAALIARQDQEDFLTRPPLVDPGAVSPLLPA